MSVSDWRGGANLALRRRGGRRRSVAKSTVRRQRCVVFTCNHCPYALAWQDRIAQVADDYAARGVRVLAINSKTPTATRAIRRRR